MKNRVKELRQTKGLMQGELARMIGVSQSTLSYWEMGKYDIDPESMKRLAEIFDVSVDYLIYNDSVKRRKPLGAFSNVIPIATKKVPLLGTIACGEPLYAEEQYGEYAVVSNEIDCDFCLRAKGDSMTGADQRRGSRLRPTMRRRRQRKDRCRSDRRRRYTQTHLPVAGQARARSGEPRVRAACVCRRRVRPCQNPRRSRRVSKHSEIMATAKKTASGSWRIQIYAGKVNGKRQYIQFTRPSKREAELAALEWQGSRPSRQEMTLRQAYRQYIADRDAVLSPSTIREYTRIAEHASSLILDAQIERITLAEVQHAINDLSRKYAPKTVKNRYGLFTAVMRTFCPDRTFRVALPRQKKKDVYIPEPETISRLYEKAKGKWIEIPFLLAAECGLRASEIAGLKYDCVSAHSITIKRAVVASSSGFIEKGPKSLSGARVIPCRPELLSLIGTGAPDEYVIKGENRKYISTRWHEFISQTGERPFSFHKLRHYFASAALLSGIPKRYVADLMGHRSEHMLDQVYEHVFQSARDQFAEKLLENSILGHDAGTNAGDDPESPDT